MSAILPSPPEKDDDGIALVPRFSKFTYILLIVCTSVIAWRGSFVIIERRSLNIFQSIIIFLIMTDLMSKIAIALQFRLFNRWLNRFNFRLLLVVLLLLAFSA